jgi:hypothetical protein
LIYARRGCAGRSEVQKKLCQCRKNPNTKATNTTLRRAGTQLIKVSTNLKTLKRLRKAGGYVVFTRTRRARFGGEGARQENRAAPREPPFRAGGHVNMEATTTDSTVAAMSGVQVCVRVREREREFWEMGSEGAERGARVRVPADARKKRRRRVFLECLLSSFSLRKQRGRASVTRLPRPRAKKTKKKARPLNARERDEGCRMCVSYEDTTKQVVLEVRVWSRGMCFFCVDDECRRRRRSRADTKTNNTHKK